LQNNTPEFDLYVKGRDYNNKLHPPYYPTVDKNYRFYSNDQWHGVKSNGLPTPVFNILKQIVDYKISSMTSNKTKMQFGVENMADDSQEPQDKELQQVCDIISGYSETKWEKLKMNSLLREVLLDGAVSGDMCFYTYWDSTIDSGSTNGMDAQGQPVKVMGDFITEVVDGSNVMFGNPNSNKVQSQPYILIAGRKLVSELREKAKANKIPADEINNIVADNDYQEQAGDRGKIELDNAGEDTGKCLYLIKLWKERSVAPLVQPNKVMMKIVTKSATIQKDTDTGLTLYPIAWANWDLLKNSYHGQAEITGLIPNQILINQMFANIAYFMRMMAFGKVVYDKTRINSWNNAIGAAIGVEGDTLNAVHQLQPGQMNPMIMNAFDKAVTLTKDLAGANDAALGNVDPKNTSAIIAVQKQSSIPLEAVKDRMYQLIEDLGLIWLDFMINKYDIERKISYKQGDVTQVGTFNGSQYKDVPFKLKIDVGPSSYWSEITSLQTLDNLLAQQKISFIQYLERIPNGILPKKQELIDEINTQNQALAQQQAAQQQQAQQMSVQSQQMAQQTQQLQQAHKNLQYEQMAKFVDTLAPNVRAQLEKLPDNQYEQAVMQLMDAQKQGKLNPQLQNNNINPGGM